METTELRGQPIEVWREALANLERDRHLRSGTDLSKGGHWRRVCNIAHAGQLYPFCHPHYGNIWRSAKVSQDHYVIAETYARSEPRGGLVYHLGQVVHGEHSYLGSFTSLPDAREEAAQHWRAACAIQ